MWNVEYQLTHQLTNQQPTNVPTKRLSCLFGAEVHYAYCLGPNLLVTSHSYALIVVWYAAIVHHLLTTFVRPQAVFFGDLLVISWIWLGTHTHWRRQQRIPEPLFHISWISIFQGPALRLLSCFHNFCCPGCTSSWSPPLEPSDKSSAKTQRSAEWIGPRVLLNPTGDNIHYMAMAIIATSTPIMAMGQYQPSTLAYNNQQ